MEQGRRGGLARAQRLSAIERRAIASKAANARWKMGADGLERLTSIRLDHPRLDDPVFLEEVLLEGSLAQWRIIYEEISEHPYGPTAVALEKVLSSIEVYGIVPLWRGILITLRGEPV